MKKIVVLLLLVCSAACSAQQTIAPTPMTKSDYLAKAKRQNSTGWVLLGSGFLINSAGLIGGGSEAANDFYNLFSLQETKKTYVGGVLLIIGTATMLGSIPLFIASSRNRRTAATMTASFKIEETDLPFKAKRLAKSFPVISLRMSL